MACMTVFPMIAVPSAVYPPRGTGHRFTSRDAETAFRRGSTKAVETETGGCMAVRNQLGAMLIVFLGAELGLVVYIICIRSEGFAKTV